MLSSDYINTYLLWNPNRITPFFNDNKKMKCPFILISTGLNVGPLAATTFQIARTHTYPKYVLHYNNFGSCYEQ